VLEIDLSSISAWIYRGIALHRLNRYEDALASFEEALEINTSDPAAWHFKGEVLNKIGLKEESDDALAKAASLGWKWEVALH
jgi:tetratricopeptide (TPR) repeat protein